MDDRAVFGHDTNVRLCHRDIQAGKIQHVGSPLPMDGADPIGLRGRATDHYPMLIDSHVQRRRRFNDRPARTSGGYNAGLLK